MPWQEWREIAMSPWFYISGVVLYAVLTTCVLLLLRRSAATTHGRWRDGAEKSALVLLAILFCLLAVEGYMRFLNTGNGNQIDMLAAQWMKRNWTPVNSLGYRDDDHSPGDLEQGKTIFVVGDSFTAGLGVADYRQTFPKQLEQILGAEFRVVTIADHGWNVGDYHEALTNYPFQQPNAVVLNLFCNDIEVDPMELPTPNLPRLFPGGALGFLTNTSFAISAAYAQIVLVSVMPELQQGLLDLFANPEYLERLNGYLDRLTEYAESRDAPLIVMVWPMFPSLDQSDQMNRHFFEFFDGRTAIVMDMKALLEHHTPMDLVVSRTDIHPNERAHELAARWLAEVVVEATAGASSRTLQ